MKRAAAGVACLTAALSGVYAAPANRHGKPPRAQAELGDAMTASIHDAIQGAVLKVHQAHHPAVSAKPADVASAALSTGRKATKVVPVKISEVKPHVLTQQASLRGHAAQKASAANPWETAKPLRIMDHDLQPVAPMDRLTPGIEAQQGGLFPPGYWPRVVYYKDHQDRPNPFPNTYGAPVPKPSENFLVCKTSPDEWVDKQGFNCKYYSTALWCTPDGKLGPKWNKKWGTFKAFAIKDVGASQACCECGGGARMSVVGGGGEQRLEDRHLLAPPDRLPDPQARWFEKNNGHFDIPERPLRPNQAPEDAVPMPIRQVAPLDSVEMKYSRYLNELHKQNGKTNPRGFSVQYYNVPPPDCGPELKPVASSLDLSLDYQGSASLLAVNTSIEYSPVGLDAKSLQWPTKKTPVGGLWWAKWSGTLIVLEGGKYDFNLDLGFNSNSWLKVDGMKVLTDGQCTVSQDAGTCKAKGCAWDKEKGSCAAAGAKPKKPAAGPKCKKGTYRASPILFGSEAKTGEVDVVINPAGATTVLTVPTGVKNFQITIHSEIGADLQIQDKGSDTWVVKFDGGIVNNQQRDGTYHGMAISFSGDNPAAESAKLNGVTTSDMEVTLMSYSANPATVKMSYAHGGIQQAKTAPPKGCEKLVAADAKKIIIKWSEKMQQRYHVCPHAWQAVIKAYPGGQISWNQWESVWSMAWGQETAGGEPGGAKAWQMAFAAVDTSADGYVQETEFLKSCTMGGPAGAGPAPAPAPLVAKVPKTGKNQDVKLDTCLTVKVMDKASWPKDAFKGTGYKDHEVLGQLIGSPVSVKENKPKGVMLASPDGKASWFYPKGTFYCIQATQGASPAGAPASMVSSGGPAPSIANIVPVIVGGAPAPGGLHTLAPRAFIDLEEDLPTASLENSMSLAPGGHCIEAMVMVTPSARNLQLKYKGPDTHGEEVVVPGQMVHCDPVIPACATPLRDMCLNFKNQKCAPSAAPGPAPAPAR